jgi:hypothetical protein
VNALKSDEMRAYIEQEAKKLCLPPEETADYAMRGYKVLTTNDFKKGTTYSICEVGSPQDSNESEDISDTPPF